MTTPRRSWPPFLSVDIETYGKLASNPPHTVFNPRRSHLIDGIPPHRQILTVAVTPITSPNYDLTRLDAHTISQWTPQPTMVFNLINPKTRTRHLNLLASYLQNATLLLGTNFQFDLSYLRANHTILRRALPPQAHLIVDLMVLSYLESEVRPEKSLKSLGPILGTHTYDSADLQQLPTIEAISQYNAQDTTNTISAAASLARRIHHAQRNHTWTPSDTLNPIDTSSITITTSTLSDPPPDTSPTNSMPGPTGSTTTSGSPPKKSTKISSNPKSTNTDTPSGPTSHNIPLSIHAKLSYPSLLFYSNTLYSTTHMTHSGVPLSKSKLTRLFKRLERRTNLAAEAASNLIPPLKLQGPGSDIDKRSLLKSLVIIINEHHSQTDPSFDFLSHPSLEITKTGLISSTEPNRNLIASFLPPHHPYRLHFYLWSLHTHSQKLLSTYCYPLLYHKRKDPLNRSSKALPHSIPQGNPDTLLSHPSWFIIPSAFKDGSGSTGGTLQARITAKDPAHQTDPPSLQRCRQSRYTNGALVSLDLSQIELRVAALLSSEPSLVLEYQKPNPDVHSDMTVQLFGPSILQHPHFKDGTPDDPRQTGKAANFLVLFRGGPDALQSTVLDYTGKLLPLPQCEAHIDRITRARPVLYQWQESLIRQTLNTKRLILPITGQSRTFAGGTKYEVNEIVNFPIQTVAANTLLTLQHLLIPYLEDNPRIHLYLNVYDALYFDCATPQLAHSLKAHINHLLQTIATNGYWAYLSHLYGNTVPLVADIKVHPPSPPRRFP
jgi:hypothetical protein